MIEQAKPSLIRQLANPIDMTRLACFFLVVIAIFKQSEMSMLVAIFVTLVQISLILEGWSIKWRTKPTVPPAKLSGRL